jgi:hypothetical protein
MYAPESIEDHPERNRARRELFESMNGNQVGDPAKLAQALLTLTELERPPLRFIAGTDALAAAEESLGQRQQQIDAFPDLSTSLAHDDVSARA